MRRRGCEVGRCGPLVVLNRRSGELGDAWWQDHRMWTRPDPWAGHRAVTGGLPSSGGHGVRRATADAGGGARAAPPGGAGGRADLGEAGARRATGRTTAWRGRQWRGDGASGWDTLMTDALLARRRGFGWSIRVRRTCKAGRPIQCCVLPGWRRPWWTGRRRTSQWGDARDSRLRAASDDCTCSGGHERTCAPGSCRPCKSSGRSRVHLARSPMYHAGCGASRPWASGRAQVAACCHPLGRKGSRGK